MGFFFNRISIWFAAGALGGLANAFAVGLYQKATATTFLGIKISKSLSTAMIYEYVVWGGLWGAVFIVPILFKNVFIRGVLYSLAPSIIQLFVVFPGKGEGFLGLNQGAATPVQVFAFNAIWGITAVFWLKMADKKY